MRKINLPLASSTWNKSEVKEAIKVLKSGNLTMGKNVLLFEKKLSKFFKSKYCVMCNSGSSANLLMASVLKYHSKIKLKQNAEVIVPSIAWSTSYSPFHHLGFKLKFVDIDLNTLNYDLKLLKKAINKNTKVILAVNILGNPNNFGQIKKIINKNKIVLLEDNCESMGAKYNKKYTGTFGLIGSFSTFYSHHISTMEGGFLCTSDEESYNLMLSLRAHGWTRDLPKKNIIYKFDKNFQNEKWNFILPGFNVRPGEIHAAIGIQQLKKLKKFLIIRKKNALYFNNLFKNNIFYIQKEIGTSSWFAFVFILKHHHKRKIHNLKNLLKKLHIEFRPIVAGNFTKKRAIKYIKHNIYSECKNAEYADKYGIMIANHHYDIRDKLLALKNSIDIELK